MLEKRNIQNIIKVSVFCQQFCDTFCNKRVLYRANIPVCPLVECAKKQWYWSGIPSQNQTKWLISWDNHQLQAELPATPCQSGGFFQSDRNETSSQELANLWRLYGWVQMVKILCCVCPAPATIRATWVKTSRCFSPSYLVTRLLFVNVVSFICLTSRCPWERLM